MECSWDCINEFELFTKKRLEMKTKKHFQILFFTLLSCLFFYQTPVLAQDIMDQASGDHNWASFRNMNQRDYQAKLNEYKAKGMRPIDVEITGGNTRTYSIIFRQNKDRRNWELRTALSSQDYNKKWTEMKNKGFRPVDQETHLLKGKRYFGALWVQNKEKYKWVSYRNITSQQFAQRFTEYKGKGYMPIDIDVYPSGNELRYSVIWVQNTKGLQWAEFRNLTKSTFGSKFSEMRGKGYRLIDTEPYLRNGRQEYAAIYVKDNRKWAARRDMTSVQFNNAWNEYKDEGYRLIDQEIYKTSSGTRYAGVWVMNKSRLNWRLKKEVDRDVAAYKQINTSVGMSIAIAERGQIRYLKGVGYADLSKGKKAHGNTVFRLASISKAISGILAFQLKQRGALNLNAPTRTYETRLSGHHTHTVGQLLSNRGKVRGYIRNDPAGERGTARSYSSAWEASSLFRNDRLISDSYKYSTHGYTIAAIALEKAGRSSMPILLPSRLSGPFKIPSLQCEDLRKNVSERSLIYKKKPSGFGFVEADPLSLSWKYAGGGMEASAYDLARLGVQLMDNEIISAENLKTMTTPPVNDGNNYAYGWNTGTYDKQKFFSKSGGQEGAKSYMICFPEKDIVVVILCNTRVNSLSAFAKELAAKMW